MTVHEILSLPCVLFLLIFFFFFFFFLPFLYILKKSENATFELFAIYFQNDTSH